jgi:hypothetical protein
MEMFTKMGVKLENLDESTLHRLNEAKSELLYNN